MPSDHALTRFRWEREVISKRGPANPTTRLVMLTLATYTGRDLVAYPSAMTLAAATALTERAVRTHLDIAEQEGWIRRTLRGEGKGWRNYVYTLSLPSLRAEPHSAAGPINGAERRSGANEFPAEAGAIGAEAGAVAAEPDDSLVRNDVPTNNVPNTAQNIEANIARAKPECPEAEQPRKPNGSDQFRRLVTEAAKRLGLKQGKSEGNAAFAMRVAAAEARAKQQSAEGQQHA